MKDEFGITTRIELYVYLVKLLGMAGEFEEAYHLIDSLAEPVDSGFWEHSYHAVMLLEILSLLKL